MKKCWTKRAWREAGKSTETGNPTESKSASKTHLSQALPSFEDWPFWGQPQVLIVDNCPSGMTMKAIADDILAALDHPRPDNLPVL